MEEKEIASMGDVENMLNFQKNEKLSLIRRWRRWNASEIVSLKIT